MINREHVLQKTGKQRGFTLVELLIAAGLSMAFGVILAISLTSTSELVRSSTEKALLEQQVRDVVDVTTRYMRSARALGYCEHPETGATPVDSCIIVTERDAPFVTAEENRAVFYSYADVEAAVLDGTGTYLSVPHRVEIYLDIDPNTGVGGVVVERYDPLPGSTYTTPDWETEGDIIAVMTAARPPASEEQEDPYARRPIPPMFQYYSATGTRLDVDGVVATNDLIRVALVRFSPRASNVIHDPYVAGLDFFINIPGSSMHDLASQR